MKYSADTSFFINGWHKQYPPKNFASLWEKIEALIGDGHLCSIDEVKLELEKQADDVHTWARQQSGLFVPLEANVQDALKVILKEFPGLARADRPRGKADPFVVALAEANSCIVITDENMNQSLENPKIPLVCQKRGIECIRFVDLIRRENWKF